MPSISNPNFLYSAIPAAFQKYKTGELNVRALLTEGAAERLELVRV